MRGSSGSPKTCWIVPYSTSTPVRVSLSRLTSTEKKAVPVADKGGLLHVVRDDHDRGRVLLLEFLHHVFDGTRGDRVQRRGGLVHQDDVIRLNDRSTVVLPLPDEPMNAVISRS